jgi:SAM-dependent methyltransferase
MQAAFEASDFVGGYDALLVPRLFGPWAEFLLAKVRIEEGDRVIDVATGPGTVARIAAAMAGPSGHVTAADLSPPMLAVARAKGAVENSAPIDYRETPAAPLEAESGAYDVVTCQHGLQFFPDKPAAVAEMFRVLRPGGRIGVAVWRSIDHLPPFAAFERAIREVGGDVLANMFAGGPFGFDDPDALRSLLDDAGFVDVELTRETLPFVFEQGAEQVASMIATVPIPQIAALGSDERARMREVIKESLTDVTADGVVSSYATANIAIARKGS